MAYGRTYRRRFRNRKRDVEIFMARELQQTAPDDRRRRVQRLKKMIIGIVIVGLLIPILCCVYLICRLHAINGTLRDLEQRLEELDARDRERQTLLQQLQSETAIQQGVQTQEEVTSGISSFTACDRSSFKSEKNPMIMYLRLSLVLL